MESRAITRERRHRKAMKKLLRGLQTRKPFFFPEYKLILTKATRKTPKQTIGFRHIVFSPFISNQFLQLLASSY